MNGRMELNNLSIKTTLSGRLADAGGLEVEPRAFAMRCQARPLYLGVPQEQLHGTQVPGAPVDQRCLGASHRGCALAPEIGATR